MWERERYLKPLNDYYKMDKVSLKVAFSDEQKTELKHLAYQYPSNDRVAISKFYYRVNPKKYFRKVDINA